MLNIIRSSIIYRLLRLIGMFFGSQWRSSFLVSAFLNFHSGKRSGLIYNLSDILLNGWRRFFRFLKLEKLFRNSVFQMPHIWCGAALFAAPIVPTMVLLAIVLIAFAVTALRSGMDLKAPTHLPNSFVFLFAIVYFLSVFASVTFAGSVRHGATHTVFILFAVIIFKSITDSRKFEWVIRLFVLSGTLVCAYGVYQYVFGVSGASAWLDSSMFSDIGTRVYSTLDNPNVLAEYILLVVPFSLALTITSESQPAKIFFGLCTAGIILCMVLTYARGGWLGLIAATAVMLIIIDRRFILLGIAGIIALYFTLPDSILNRFLSIGNLSDGSTSYRLNIWLGSLSMLKDYWFSGVGPGVDAFNQVYPLYSYNTAVAQHSHNLFLQIVCDSGAVGLVTFTGLIWRQLRMLSSGIKRSAPKTKKFYYLNAALASLIGFLVQGMTDYSFYNYRVTLVFWAIIGLGAATLKFDMQDKS